LDAETGIENILNPASIKPIEKCMTSNCNVMLMIYCGPD